MAKCPDPWSESEIGLMPWDDSSDGRGDEARGPNRVDPEKAAKRGPDPANRPMRRGAGDPGWVNLTIVVMLAAVAGFYAFTFRVDPIVDAFLVDAQGNRLGWSEGTGPVQEIPNSLYVGNEDGFGWIFDPPTGPLRVLMEKPKGAVSFVVKGLVLCCRVSLLTKRHIVFQLRHVPPPAGDKPNKKGT